MKEREAPRCLGCPIHKAILNYSRTRFSALARNASDQLEQFAATGSFDNEHVFRTLWDEYCHEIQEGKRDPIKFAFSSTVSAIVQAIVKAIDNTEAVLLTIGARRHLDIDQETSYDGVAVPDLIQRNLEDAIETLAMFRDMSEFDREEEEGPWPIRVEDVAPLERLVEALRSLAPLAHTGNDLIALGEVCGAIENILESQIVDVNVGLTIGFRHGDTDFIEGIFTCIRVNSSEIILDELHTSYSSDVGSDHFTRVYTSLEPGGGFDEAEIGGWISQLEELRALGAELSVERHR